MEHKKNCGCGQDPCVTYGAESFDAQTWNIKCDVCGEKPIYDTVDSEDYGKEIQVCEECFNGIFAAESNSANDDISLMMNLIDEIEANDIWNETINEMIRRGKAVRRPDGKVIFSDRVPQFDIIEDIAQYTTPEIKSAENSDHWMTFGRVDYNWVTDPEDLELTDENFYIIDAHIRDEVRYVIDNDNDNSSGESNLSSGDLNLTQEDEDEFTIYYYWGSPFTTGVNSAESEDDGPTNCGVCEVKIGYDEAIHYEELEWCEKCYEEQMERDMQNYTHDETDCISCGFAISPNDVRVELVEGLCPDCNEYKWNNGEKVLCCCSEPTRKDDFCPEGGYNNSGDECKFECGHEECEAEMKAKYGAESFGAEEFFRCKNCDYNVELEVEAVFEDGLCSNCLVKEGFQKEYGTHGKWMKNGEYAKKIKGATYEDYDAESFEAEYNLIGRRKPRKLSLKVSDLKEALENANDDADVFVGDITPVWEEMIGEPIVSAPRGVWTNGEEVYIVGATDWIHTEQIDELTWNRVNRAKGAESFEAEDKCECGGKILEIQRCVRCGAMADEECPCSDIDITLSCVSCGELFDAESFEAHDHSHIYPSEELTPSHSHSSETFKSSNNNNNIMAAESKFDKLSDKIAKQYRKKGMSAKKAKEIGNKTAYTIGKRKYGKAGMAKKARAGMKAESFEAEKINTFSEIENEWKDSSVTIYEEDADEFYVVKEILLQ